MNWTDAFKSLMTSEHRLAWIIAMAADAIQIVALPFFVEGAMSPADSVLDVLVGLVLIRLLGWHWAFLPSLAAELIPGMDLFPTWTAAVWFVTRQKCIRENRRFCRRDLLRRHGARRNAALKYASSTALQRNRCSPPLPSPVAMALGTF
jgi:hypothetical protein